MIKKWNLDNIGIAHSLNNWHPFVWVYNIYDYIRCMVILGNWSYLPKEKYYIFKQAPVTM